jgi:hypothetical protein
LFDQDGAPFEQTSNIDNGPVKMTQWVSLVTLHFITLNCHS